MMVLVPKPSLIFVHQFVLIILIHKTKNGGGLGKKANGNKHFSSIYLSAFTLQLFEVY